jgi:hypothetical protein
MVIRYTEIYAGFVCMSVFMRITDSARPEKSTGLAARQAAPAESFSANWRDCVDHDGLASFDAFPSREIP